MPTADVAQLNFTALTLELMLCLWMWGAVQQVAITAIYTPSVLFVVHEDMARHWPGAPRGCLQALAVAREPPLLYGLALAGLLAAFLSFWDLLPGHACPAPWASAMLLKES